jgi:hypothetical protein
MKFTTRLALLALLSLVTVLGLSSVASAAVPDNDNFSAAKVVSGQSYSENPAIDITDATVEGGEIANSPDSGNETRSIWFTWTAPASGYLNVASCNLAPGFAQTSVGIFKPDMATRLSGTIYASDGCGGYGGAVAGTLVTNGEQYWIRVAGSDETQVGSASFYLNLNPPPDNDNFADADDLGEGANQTATGNTAASTAEPGEGVPDSVWFKWDPPINANYSIAVCSGFGGDVIAKAFTSAYLDPEIAQLTLVDSTGTAGSCANNEGDYFVITRGPSPQGPLWIQVSSIDANQPANFTLTLSSSPLVGNPPSIYSDSALVGSTWEITSPGSWVGAAPIDFDYRWDICDENGENCFTVPFETGLTFDTTGWEVDLIGGTLRGGVQGSNALGVSDFAQSEPSPVFDGDSDGDGVLDSVDSCPQDHDGGSGKPNGCPTEVLNVGLGPSLSGSAVLGETITVDPGEVVNNPGIDPDANAALGSAIEWYACTAAADTGTCTQRTGSNTTYTISESNTPADSDGEKFLRAKVTWTNGGDDIAELWTDATTKVVDKCPSDLQGTGKTNGCPTISIQINANPAITGTAAFGSVFSLTTPGTASNSPLVDPDANAALDSTPAWFACSDANDSGSCVQRSTDPTYTSVETNNPATSDGEKYIRARVRWSNGDTTNDVWSPASGKIVDKCPSNLQGSGKTNGCPWITIDVVDQPSLSGTPQSGQTLTLTAGSAENNPSGLDPDVSAPIVVSRVWERCNSIAPDDCQELVDLRHGDTYPLTSADVGKRVRVKVTWFNQEEDEDVAVVVTAVSAVITAPPAPPVGTPAAPTLLKLSDAIFPKKLSIKKIVKAKGKFKLKGVQLACPAGGAACTIELALTTKAKRKTVKLGTSSMTIPAGSTMPLAGKLSKSGLKIFNKTKKITATITLAGKGGAEGKATFRALSISR